MKLSVLPPFYLMSAPGSRRMSGGPQNYHVFSATPDSTQAARPSKTNTPAPATPVSCAVSSYPAASPSASYTGPISRYASLGPPPSPSPAPHSYHAPLTQYPAPHEMPAHPEMPSTPSLYRHYRASAHAYSNMPSPQEDRMHPLYAPGTLPSLSPVGNTGSLLLSTFLAKNGVAPGQYQQKRWTWRMVYVPEDHPDPFPDVRSTTQSDKDKIEDLL
jgi:hypothetical protein